MEAARIAICSRFRLYGECLERSLNAQSFACSLFSSHEIVSVDSRWSGASFDVVIIEAALGPEVVSAILAKARCRAPIPKIVLMLSASCVAAYQKWLELGCQAIAFEDGPLDELLAAVRTTLNGKIQQPCLSAVNSWDAAAARSRRPPIDPCPIDTVLTPREREVLRLISEYGLSNKEIACRLSVSLHTVKNHVHSIIVKLGVHNRVGAIHAARQHPPLASPSLGGTSTAGYERTA